MMCEADKQCVKSVLPEDGDGASPRNVVFKRVNAAVRPRRLYCEAICVRSKLNESTIRKLRLSVRLRHVTSSGYKEEFSYVGNLQ
jgi:hypothetical protein